ncbi:hypothetical protein SAMN05216388_100634 [Halorientalis persicus]|uniref:Dolichyl-phosphate-mannose-protein mannosyltransferase n=1 Tax=Halorientalis persicus TaxID=1367881 RepID=A0A1H8KEV9_9EURY|nr:hypothetical protein [Halorientalis persicus]SEN91201.1 hypothetical protein SAMN05216388_100634 [Halorientalis persicus]
MSTLDSGLGTRLAARTAAVRTGVWRVLFGDRRGLALFLCGLCFFGLYWRMGIYITDGSAIANTLVNVAEGRVVLTEVPYGSGLEAPGTYVGTDGPVGRNYGIVVLAVPVLYALQGLGAVLDLSVVLIGVWSLALVGAATTVGRLVDREWVVVGGSVLAVGAFLANVAFATPVAPSLYPVLALQIVGMVAAALSGVFCYRLVACLHGQRIGVAAGAAVLVATPIAFWAALLKRHSFTVLCIAAALYVLARSRTAADADDVRRFRALAYVPVALLAWIHAAEALLLFVPLVVVDFATATRNDRRTIAVIAGTFALALVPFFVTNLLVAGSPIQPPRMLPSYGAAEGLDLSGGGGGGGGGLLTAIPLVGGLVRIVTRFVSLLAEGAVVALTEPGRWFRTFLRGGYIPAVASEDGFQAIRLTVLESAPILAGIAAAPVAAGLWVRRRSQAELGSHLRSPAGVVDTVALASGVLFVCLFLPRLPLHAQVTVRYLHPLFLLGVYGLARLPAVRSAVTHHWRTTGLAYGGTVFIGGQLVVIALTAIEPGLGEAVQFHALLALATAVVLAVWAVARTLSGTVPERAGAVLLGVTAAVGTIFVLLSGIEYFAYAGEFALPVVRWLSAALPLA